MVGTTPVIMGRKLETSYYTTGWLAGRLAGWLAGRVAGRCWCAANASLDVV